MTNEELQKENDEFKNLLYQVFEILNIEEESDSGRRFRPNNISSCRAMDGQRLAKIFSRLEEMVDYQNNS